MLFSESLFNLIDEVERFLLKDHKVRSDYANALMDFSDILKDRIMAEDRLNEEEKK